jgi:hypothetical protein
MTDRTAEQQQKYDDAITRIVLARNATKFYTDQHLIVGSETAVGTVEQKHLDAAARYRTGYPGSEHNTEHISFRYED